MADLLTAHDLPAEFSYPRQFIRVVECGLLDLEPWRVLTGDRLRKRLAGLRARYPSRSLVPFAARRDNDDVACWEAGHGERVVIIHDFASPGFEDQGSYTDFTTWLREAFAEFIEWDS